MDFDEYEYLEKAVEELDDRDSSKKRRESLVDNNERSYRRKDGEKEEDMEEERRRIKKLKVDEDENGGRRDRHRSSRDQDRDRDRGRNRDRDRERDTDRDLEKEKDREKSGRERERKDRDKEKEKEKEKREREKERERKERERERRSTSRLDKERERRSSSRSEREIRSSSRPRRDEKERDKEREIRERERDIEMRESRRYKEKKEAEPEADPERDQRTVFAYQMPLKATERDVYEFFSKAGKVRDVRLIMDRNSRRSKGVGYIEFYDVMSVPMAIALSGQLLLGQPVMVKPSEAEKNLVQSTATVGGAGATGPYGAVDRKLYVGNLHFNMTEIQLRQIFEPFGPVEVVQLPLDLETGQCKGFGFVQFAQLENSKLAQSSLNGKLEIAGRTIKVSSVTDHVGTQDTVAKSADFDDDDGGGLSLNAQSRALLMQKLDRTGTATSIAGSLGLSTVNGSTTSQPHITLPINGQVAFPAQVVPAPFVSSPIPESVGQPSECLLLKNMFDPTTETEPDFDLDIKEDVEEECSKYGSVKHIFVDKHSAGHVYLRFDSVEGAAAAQRAMHMRWFARRLIAAIYMQPHEYEAKFP